MESHGISNIPGELQIAILRELPTVEDVFSAIQSHRSLNKAFREDHSILVYVLCKQIDARLLPYVAVFLELDGAPRVKLHRNEVFQILEKCFSTTPQQATKQLSQLALRGALHAMILHKTIKKLATRYASQALALLYAEELLKTPGLSFHPSETYRIERTFYVFELYCSLFGHFQWSCKDQLDLFFKRFAPWENEQLACIHDFLLDEMTRRATSLSIPDVFVY